MDSTEPAGTAETTEAEAGAGGKDCLICDKVLAAGGLLFAAVLAYMSADLLTGGAITAALFGRRDPAVWDVPEAEAEADAAGAGVQADAAEAEGEAPSA